MPTIGVGAIVAGTVVTQTEADGMVVASTVTVAGTAVVTMDTVAVIMATVVVTDTINKLISYNVNRLPQRRPVCVKAICS
jgi:hypothetical protein